jgi:Tol biopolymer transport system component
MGSGSDFLPGGGKLKKISVMGGSSLILCESGGSYGASWGSNDTIFFSPGSFSGIWQVSGKGGVPQAFSKLDTNKGEISHRWPQVLPGGKAVLFTVRTGPGWDEEQVQLQMLESSERRVLVQGGRSGHYVPSGHIVYSRAGALMAVPFNPELLQVAATAPLALGEDALEGAEGTHYTVSENGLLAYVPGSSQYERSLMWIDRSGKSEPLPLPPRSYQTPRISPDGQQVAFTTEGPTTDLWIYTIARQSSAKLSSEGSSQFPIWTRDGKRLTYRITQLGTRNLFWRMVDGSGSEERLTAVEGSPSPGSWSQDGQVLAYTNTDLGNDLWILPLSDRKAQPFLRTPFNEATPRFSPDGQWLAYISDESGRYEVYVQPYPGPGGRWQISTDGGTEPVWNPKGGELFYRSGDKMMEVQITTHPSFALSKPRVLFERRFFVQTTSPNYDVSPDGQRFLMIKPDEQTASPTQISVVLNWFEELKQKVPVRTK